MVIRKKYNLAYFRTNYVKIYDKQNQYLSLPKIPLDINRLFAYCKGGIFYIHIWVWFGYFIKSGFIYNLVKS